MVRALTDCASFGVSTLLLSHHDSKIWPNGVYEALAREPSFACVDGVLAPAGEDAAGQELAAEILRQAGR
ncbi:MAG: hypothetical protein Q4C85_07670 [Actinomyces sp.]|uniref:hypothetical protein n=1 Tax=Actinomyces sp. TaxID=29317 RepID=UPI0026DC235A|nr:hypothetical protein [Actinomyces sp.]MDO4243621.1 hypothetical protein [Actinomyces sp.]